MKKFISSIVIAALSAAVIQAAESFGGFGISVYPGKKGASVASVLPNSPATQAGLQAGDVIISVNGTALSSVPPENQISLLRGNTDSTVNLVVNRNGKNLNIYAKRADISVQDLETSEVSNWFGKSENLTLEELNYLASLKIGENYELLGVMQEGFLVDSDMEQLNPQPMQHISMKKETVPKDDIKSAKPQAQGTSRNGLNLVSRSTISLSLIKEDFAKVTILNAKGSIVWQKNLGKLPAGNSNIDWSGVSLPAGSYHARLEAGSTVLTHKFELR